MHQDEKKEENLVDETIVENSDEYANDIKSGESINNENEANNKKLNDETDVPKPEDYPEIKNTENLLDIDNKEKKEESNDNIVSEESSVEINTNIETKDNENKVNNDRKTKYNNTENSEENKSNDTVNEIKDNTPNENLEEDLSEDKSSADSIYSVINLHKKLSIGKIAKLSGVDKKVCSQIVNILEKKNLVKTYYPIIGPMRVLSNDYTHKKSIVHVLAFAGIILMLSGISYIYFIS